MKNLGPAWLKNAVFYHIYPSSYCDSNGDGMGDLPGIISKLDYIASLGINAIWLSPCFCSAFHDGGYDISDYRHVDPRFGTDADLDKLFAEAHKRGIKVCLDMVAGHTSLEHPWFKASASATPNPYWNYYIWTDDWMRPTYDMKMEAGFGDRNGCFLINYFSVQPALNYGFAKVDPRCPWQLPVNHPDVLKVRQELKDTMRYYLDRGADGFRCDMACSLVKNDPGKKETIKLWQEIRAMFDQDYPEAVLISEWSYAPQALKAGFHCDLMIHCGTPAYTTLFRNEEKRDLFNKFVREWFFEKDGHDYSVSNRNSYFDAAGLGTPKQFFDIYLEQLKKTHNLGYISLPSGSHDIPRISDFRDDTDLAVVFAFLLTLPGVPFIYYGDEIGMKNLKGLPSKEGSYTRSCCRTPMQWDKSKNAGFSSAPAKDLYFPIDPDKNRPTVAAQQKQKDSLWHTVQALIALKKQHPALQADANMELLLADYPLVYTRSLGKEKLLVVIQPAERPWNAKVKCNAKNLTSLLGKDITAELNNGTLNLAGNGRGFAVFKI